MAGCTKRKNYDIAMNIIKKFKNPPAIEYMDNESSSNEVEPTPIVNNTAPTLSIKKRKLTKEEEIAFEIRADLIHVFL